MSLATQTFHPFVNRMISRDSFPGKTPYVIITLLYGAVSTILFLTYGVKYVNDSRRYLEYATLLSDGFFFDIHNFWYIGYAGFLFTIRIVSEQLSTIIVVQYVISYLAVLALYQTSLQLFNSRPIALLAAISFILFIEIPTWNSYILAESFYISCICFSLYALVTFKNNYTVFNFFTVAVVITFTSLIKPTGIALFVAAASALLYQPIKNIRNPWFKGALIIVFLAVVAILANRMLFTYKVIENYQKGEVIYAITTLPENPDYKMLVVKPPATLYEPTPGDPPVLKIISFIVHHPLYWFQLFMTKVFFFLVHVRPYWSVWHNLFSLVFLLPVYYFFFKGIRGEKTESRILTFTFSFLLVQLLSVGITSEDWDGRFLAPLLPLLFLFSSRGIISGLEKTLKKNNTNPVA